MASSEIHPRRVTRRRLKGVCLAGGSAALALVAVFRFGVGSGPHDMAQLSAAGPHADAQIHGLRTSVYEGNGLQLRVSAGALALMHPKAFGPFRLGFLRSATVSDAVVEIFNGSDGDSPVDAIAGQLERAMAALAPKELQREVASVELGPVRVVRYSSEGPLVLLEAEHCRTSGGARPRVVCRKGILRDGGGEVAFREARYDGKCWETAAARKVGQPFAFGRSG